MDRYFFSKIARGIKFGTAAIAALACGAIIVCGALGISTVVIPICGGIAIIPAALILVENTKLIADLEKNISELKKQVKEFTEQVSQLRKATAKYENENNRFVKSNEHLAELLKQAEIKVDALQRYLDTYKEANERFSKMLETEKDNNSKLAENVEELKSIKLQYENKIAELNLIVENINSQLGEITKIKEDAEAQLTLYQTQNNEMSLELEKVRSLYNKSKEVIMTLMKTKEIFEDMAKDMVNTLSDMTEVEGKTQENVDKMTQVIEKYSQQRDQEMFDKLDTNKDGMLSMDEFIEGFE